MTSLKEKLYNLIKERGYVEYSFLVSFAAEEGYRVSNMERRMRELCHEHPIVPITAISKRHTEYVSGWKMKEGSLTPATLDKIYSAVTSGKKPTHITTNFGDGMVTITLPPAFAPKETKEQPSPLFP